MNKFSIKEVFSKQNKEADEITKKIDKSNEEVAQEILKELGNTKTKVVFDKDIKNSYYVYLNDTIYISDKTDNKNSYYRFVLIAHECRHSIQSKLLQNINFILSNIELIAFFVLFVVSIFVKNITIPFILYAIFTVISCIPRIILEIEAIKNSINISKNYISKYLNKEESDYLLKVYKSKINTLLPFALIQLFIGKIIRIAILFVLAYYI